MKIGALVLAAGGSARLGQPKQLLKFQGETLVRRAVAAALEAGCDPIAVVVGAEAGRIDAELSGLPVVRVPNDDWQHGIGSSIRCGVEALQHCDALAILTCDQPHVDQTVISALIQTQEETGKPIAACAYAGTLGVPAIFTRDYFEKLRALPDTAGAKSIMAAQPNDVAQVAFPPGAIDIDTFQNYKGLPNE